VKGGVAWMYGSANYTCNDPTGITCGGNTGETLNESRLGWTIGTGFEFGLTPNWSARAEYDCLDFGTANYTYPIAGPVQIRETINEVKIGVNYRFSSTAILARD